MVLRVTIVLFIALLSACGGSAATQESLRTYEISCIKSGYAVDTPEYSDCVIKRYQKAQAQQNRRRDSMQ